jgi:hypothetical protein
MWRTVAVALVLLCQLGARELSRAEYEDRVLAAWTAQMIAAQMGFQFEHKVASTQWVDQYPKPLSFAPVDDDYYYEMVAVRALEKYGAGMTVEQLGRQWLENSAGSWGSSRHTRELLLKGVTPPETGHPRYNRLWFSIGPQFSGDVYGLLAPGRPNLAGKLAREYGRINGYAEGADGAVFVAGMVSLAFRESDPKTIVRQAARLIDPRSPYRQCLDMVIFMSEAGRSVREVADAVEDRWHIEYPATNNAVPNGGIIAASVWFGEGDFLKSINAAFAGGDFTDADCNAANAAAVVGAMKGMKALPRHLVEPLNDRIKGAEMGGVKLTPPVDESISALARRTVELGVKISGGLEMGSEPVRTQPAELFDLSKLTEYWNPSWQLFRAGVGGAGGGLTGIRGITYLDGDVLATWPRDEVRGLYLSSERTLGPNAVLRFDAGVDSGRAWVLEVYAGNARLLTKRLEGTGEGRSWQGIEVPLSDYGGRNVRLRLYQRVLFTDKVAGNAYWRNLRVD